MVSGLWTSVAGGRLVTTFTGHGVDGSIVIVPRALPRWIMKLSFPLQLFVSLAGSPPDAATASVFISNEAEPMIRWFSSAGVEYKMCGHGNLAAAYLWFLDASSQGSKQQEVILHSEFQRNPMTIRQSSEWGIVQELDAYPSSQIEISALPSLLLDALNLSEPQFRFAGENDIGYVLYLKQESMVGALSPNFEKLAQVDARNIVVAAASGAGVVFRCFCPRLGINEDQVTGSAGVNVAHVRGMLEKDYGAWVQARQLSESGGIMYLQVPAASGTKVLLAGHAYEGIHHDSQHATLAQIAPDRRSAVMVFGATFTAITCILVGFVSEKRRQGNLLAVPMLGSEISSP